MSSFQEFLQQLIHQAEEETGANNSNSDRQSSDPTETTADESLSSSYVMAENDEQEQELPPSTILGIRGSSSSSSLGSMEHMMQDLHNSTDDVLSRVEALIQELRQTQIMDGLSLEEDDGSEYHPFQHRRHYHDDGGGSISSMSHFSSIHSNSVNNHANHTNHDTNNATSRPAATLFLNSLSTTSSTYRPLDQPPAGRTAIPENSPSSFSLRPSMLASSFTLLSMDRKNKNSHAPPINNHVGSSSSVASLSTCHTSNEIDDLILEGTDDSSQDTDTMSPTNHRRRSFHNNNHHNQSTSVIDPMAFSNIGSLLAAAAAGAADNSTEGGWWSRFTDADWEELFATANIVYQALEEERRKKNKNVDGTDSSIPPPFSEWPLPPSDHLHSLDNNTTTEDQQSVTSSIAEDNHTAYHDDTPQEFVCPQCHEILVGATLLVNGTCPHATLCAPCVEHLYNKKESSSSNKEHNYIWVDAVTSHGEVSSSGWACSTCATHDSSLRTATTGEHGVWQWEPCPALDEAIWNAMSSSSLSSCQGMSSKQVLYYGRLREWHDRLVLRRSETLYEREHDMLVVLSTLIAQEEEAFWNDKNNKLRQNTKRGRPSHTKWRLFGEVAALLAVPMVGTLLVRP